MKAIGWIAWCSFAAAAAVGCSAAGPVEDGDAQSSVGESDDALRLRRLCAGPRELECRDNQFCDALRPGRCPGDRQLGICRGRPDVCTDEFDPVCGCDGVTYPNACNAAAAGAAVERRGECAPDGEFCGGIAGIPCPDGQTCIDDPSDDCDPNMGGADCGGICIDGTTNPCAAILCPVGSECVVKGDVGRCVPVERCGDVVCAPGLVCCNPLAGICTRPGGVCIF